MRGVGPAGVGIALCLACSSCGKEPTGEPNVSVPPKKAPEAQILSRHVEDPPAANALKIIGDVGLAEIQIPGFKGLPLKDKERLYRCFRAAAIADEVYLSRLGPVAARTRRILAGVMEAENTVPDDLREKIVPYAERFLLHRGPFDAWTGEKFRPTFIPGELAAAADLAIQRGIDLGVKEFDGAPLEANQLEQLEAFLQSVRGFVFNPGGDEAPPPTGDTEAPATAKSPAPLDKEVLSAMARALKGEEITPKNAAAGSDGGLTAFLESGEKARFMPYIAGWLKEDSPVVCLMGFVFPDPASTPSSGDVDDFAAFLAVRDDDRSPMIRKVAKEAYHFDRGLPGNAMFRRSRKTITAPNAAAYHLIGAFGAMGPATPPVFNLPLPGFAPGSSGQRTLIFTNLLDAVDGVSGKERVRLFADTDEIAYRREKWRSTGRTAFLTLKHVIGFQAGTRPAETGPATGENPLGRRSSYEEAVLEELHADLVALYYVLDPKAAAIGLVPEAECAHAIYDDYASRLIEESVPALPPDVKPDPAVAARRIAVRFAIEKGAVRVETRDGRTFASVTSPEAMRDAVKALLTDVQRMVSVADLSGFGELMSKYGGRPPRAWQEEVAARLETAGIPEKLSFDFPTLEPRLDASGKLVDVLVQPRERLTGLKASSRGTP